MKLIMVEQLRALISRGERNIDKARQALALLEAMEAVAWDDSEPDQADKLSYGQVCDILYKQPTPEPTEPAAPFPGPGWRLLTLSETLKRGDQIYISDAGWTETSFIGSEVGDFAIYRTPIYHNPANLESAGEGYRFCLVSEYESDATHWWSPKLASWESGALIPAAQLRESRYTYRTNKPLPTT